MAIRDGILLVARRQGIGEGDMEKLPLLRDDSATCQASMEGLVCGADSTGRRNREIGNA